MTDQNNSLQTVICLKWGKRYGSEYVNKLYTMVQRNTKRPLRFICITDDNSGLIESIETRPMPAFELPDIFRYSGFRRMFLFKESLYDLTGDVLHLDVDLLVTGSIDDFFDYKPEANYIVSENWTQPGAGIGNMSVFRYRIGTLTKIWDRFSSDPVGMRVKYSNSQTFCSRTLGEFAMYPLEWCIGFKTSLIPAWPLRYFIEPKRPPAKVRVVAFTGKPDMDEAMRGEWPEKKRIKRFYKFIRPTRWIAEYWK
ncbi:MAG: hypothetical protein ACK46A_08250 [Akkermansiaceae bacterium]|jgi:hypothetical protein